MKQNSGSHTNKYKAIILDFDGTLINSLDLVAAAWQWSAKKNFGVLIDKETIKKEIHGPPTEIYKRLSSKSKEFTLEKIENFLKDKEDWMEKNRKSGELFAGVEEALSEARKKGIKTAIVTSSKKNWVLAYPSFSKVKNHFDVFVFGDTIEKQKPEPEPFIYALKQLKTDSKETASIGDGISDAIASVKAGLDFYGVSTGTATKKELLDHGAKKVFSSLKEAILFLI